MRKNAKTNWVIIIVLVVFILAVSAMFISGYIGSIEAKKINATCDIYWGNNLCWKWHKFEKVPVNGLG